MLYVAVIDLMFDHLYVSTILILQFFTAIFYFV